MNDIQSTVDSLFYQSQTSVADPYHFDTDSDPRSEKIHYGSGSRPNFDTDPVPGYNDTDPDPGTNDKDPDPLTQKFDLKAIISLRCVFILQFFMTFL